MALKLYNTLGRSLQDFIPLKDKEVTIYTCGPTVYDFAHIGNFRSFVFADLLHRTLTYNDYTVHHAMNITNVDDKTIRGSQAAGEPLTTFTNHFEDSFFHDANKLNIIKPDQIARATDYIPEMVTLIEALLAKGVAYKAEDGIYFAIDKFPAYGQLVEIKNRAADSLRTRIDEYDKDNSQDFALWKFWRAEDGDIGWETSLGKGRPGWHIECSAMSMACFGPSVDIHTGGIDLIFPHHENEIAQSEAATGKPFVKYWLHSGHVMIAGQKMSKSLGNIVTLKTLEERGINPLAYRYFLLTAHYRSTINFTDKSINASVVAYQKLQTAVTALYTEVGKESNQAPIDQNYADQFLSAINNDLSTPEALALVWQLVKDNAVPSATKLATLLRFDEVLGLCLGGSCQIEEIPEAVTALATAREEARKAQDWPKSDEIRAQIASLGYDVSDTPQGPKVTKVRF